jgi:hypothetical protein
MQKDFSYRPTTLQPISYYRRRWIANHHFYHSDPLRFTFPFPESQASINFFLNVH